MTTPTIPTLEPSAEHATQPPRIGFISLGCPKNLVDSEVMMGLLHHAGAHLTQQAAEADILVVNTCSFIDSAKQESVNTILEMVAHKVEHGGRAKRLIVAGCLVERYRDEIQANIPEVDAVVGTGELESILAAAGLTPTGQPANPLFNILPQGDSQPAALPAPLTLADMAQPAIDAQIEPHLHTLPAAAHVPLGDTLVGRAASAVHQHSRPLSDPTPAPQLREAPAQTITPQLAIARSLAETGTTHGEAPLTHPGDHIAHKTTASSRPELRAVEGPASLPSPYNLQPTTYNASNLPSRPEGDARERAGRFSREAWDGATTAPLPTYLYTDATPRILATPRASAYIKIAEGCDHPCSFCIIPQLRGKFRSRRMGSVLAEAQSLIAQGVREITLIGQDTTCYGEDLGFTDGLATLLDSLAQVPGLRWLRFLYTYPNKVTTTLLETMAKHPDVIAPYLDVPLQHASPSVLRSMKRGGSAEIFLSLIERARRIVPNLVVRTSFIVGFPGETDADFDLLCDFVQKARFDWLGVFTYSDEEGARAFSLDPSLKLPKRTIEARRRRLMRLQQKISTKAKKALIGRELDLLVEGVSEETDLLWEGRSMLHAPEIDGKVFINDFGPHESLVPGTFYRAEVTESHDYDLVARILD